MHQQYNIYSIVILLSIIIRSVSYIPLILELEHKEYTQNIPYITLILELTAYLIISVIAIVKHYFVHLLFFLCASITIIYVILIKSKFDKHNTPLSK